MCVACRFQNVLAICPHGDTARNFESYQNPNPLTDLSGRFRSSKKEIERSDIYSQPSGLTISDPRSRKGTLDSKLGFQVFLHNGRSWNLKRCHSRAARLSGQVGGVLLDQLMGLFGANALLQLLP
jgi:hypothetical protein